MFDEEKDFSLSDCLAVDSLTTANYLGYLVLVDQQHVLNPAADQRQAFYLNEILLLDLWNQHDFPLEGQLHRSFADVTLNKHYVWIQSEQWI